MNKFFSLLSILLGLLLPTPAFSQVKVSIIDGKTMSTVYKYAEDRSFGKPETEISSSIQGNETLIQNTDWLAKQINKDSQFVIQREYYTADSLAYLQTNVSYAWDNISLADGVVNNESEGRHFVISKSDSAFVLLSAYRPMGFDPLESKSGYSITGKITLSAAYKLTHIDRPSNLTAEEIELVRATFRGASDVDIDTHIKEQIIRYPGFSDLMHLIGQSTRYRFGLATRDYLHEYNATLERVLSENESLKYMAMQEARLGIFLANGGEQYLILTTEVPSSFLKGESDIIVDGLQRVARELVSDSFRSYLKVGPIELSTGMACKPFSKLFH